MAQNLTAQLISEKVSQGSFPGARIYCIGKEFCNLNAHIPLTARCSSAEGAISNLCYGFNAEQDAPGYTFVDTGSGNSTNTALHSSVYWLHGYEHLDSGIRATENAVPVDVPGMCNKSARDFGCNNELMVGFSRKDHNELVDYLCFEVFEVKREDVVIFIVTTVHSLMYLFHGKMRIATKTKKTTTFSEAIANTVGTALSVDLYNGITDLLNFDETDDPLSITTEQGPGWVKSDVLSTLIQQAYICVHAAAFNMLDDLNQCRRLLLLLGQASTYTGRSSKITGFKGRDPLGLHKEAICSDMIDRVTLSTYLAMIESYSESSPSAFYKNWALKNATDKDGIVLAHSQKAMMAPFLSYAYNCPNSVGVGFKSVLKTPQELANEKAFIDKMQDGDKDQKKLTKDLNQIKVQPGAALYLPTACRVIVASGFNPHLASYAFEVLNYANESNRVGDDEAMYRSAFCHACTGDQDECFCRAIPKQVAMGCISTSPRGNNGKLAGLFLVGNKVQPFGDLEQKPYNMNASEEDIATNRKLKPSVLIQESLSRLPEEARNLIDGLLSDSLGDVTSLADRANGISSAIRDCEKADQDQYKKSMVSSVDCGQVISALKALYNSVQRGAMDYCKIAEESLNQKLVTQGPNSCKHLLQTSAFLPNYCPFGPSATILAIRTISYFVYATVHVYMCEEIFKNPSKQMIKFTSGDPLLNPTLATIAKGYMTKNYTIKADLNINAPEQSTVMKLNDSGEHVEVPCGPMQTVNTIKPISLKQNLFSNIPSDDVKGYRKIAPSLGTAIGSDESGNLFSNIDVAGIMADLKSESGQSIESLMKPMYEIKECIHETGKEELKEFLPVFSEHDSNSVNIFLHKIFSRSERDVKLKIAKARGVNMGDRLRNVMSTLIENRLVTKQEHVVCLAKYAWMLGRGKETFRNGCCPISCSDLASCLFENLVTATMEVRNETFPVSTMNKAMPLISTATVKRQKLTSTLTATLSSGYAMQTNPLLMGNVSYFAFTSKLGPILRCGITGLDIGALNKLGKTNIDTSSGTKDLSKHYYMVIPTENNFSPPRLEMGAVGLRVDPLHEIAERLQECYSEEMVINVLCDVVNSANFSTQTEALYEIKHLLQEHCDLFEESEIFQEVIARSKRKFEDRAELDDSPPPSKRKKDTLDE